jgi:hypothetical protein
MSVSLDEIAKALSDWCYQDGHRLRNYFAHQGGWETEAYWEFSNFLVPEKAKFKVVTNQPIFDSDENVGWVFTEPLNHKDPKIVAELACESIENHQDFEKQVEKNIKKLSGENIKNEFKDATKCIISLYFNIEKRNFLHKNDFIEIYNDLEIGCAIKRIK